MTKINFFKKNDIMTMHCAPVYTHYLHTSNYNPFVLLITLFSKENFSDSSSLMSCKPTPKSDVKMPPGQPIQRFVIECMQGNNNPSINHTILD